MLPAPDIAPPIEPLWPFLSNPVSVDVIYYSSIWWNPGPMTLGIAIHLLLAYLDVVPVANAVRTEKQ